MFKKKKTPIITLGIGSRPTFSNLPLPKESNKEKEKPTSAEPKLTLSPQQDPTVLSSVITSGISSSSKIGSISSEIKIVSPIKQTPISETASNNAVPSPFLIPEEQRFSHSEQDALPLLSQQPTPPEKNNLDESKLTTSSIIDDHDVNPSPLPQPSSGLITIAHDDLIKFPNDKIINKQEELAPDSHQEQQPEAQLNTISPALPPSDDLTVTDEKNLHDVPSEKILLHPEQQLVEEQAIKLDEVLETQEQKDTRKLLHPPAPSVLKETTLFFPAQLVLLDPVGKETTDVYQLNIGRSTIGRGLENDLSFGDEEFISRNHCEITYYKYQYMLKDLQSANGSFVNDVKVQETILRDGDCLQIGSLRFIFKDPIEQMKKKKEAVI